MTAMTVVESATPPDTVGLRYGMALTTSNPAAVAVTLTAVLLRSFSVTYAESLFDPDIVRVAPPKVPVNVIEAWYLYDCPSFLEATMVSPVTMGVQVIVV